MVKGFLKEFRARNGEMTTSTNHHSESMTHPAELQSTTSILHHSVSQSTAREDHEEVYRSGIDQIVSKIPDSILPLLEAQDISNLKMAMPHSTLVAGHAMRYNHDYDDAFRAFFAHSPRALRALLTDDPSHVHEVLALAVSLGKFSMIPSASNGFPVRSTGVRHPSKTGDITTIFWLFVCHSHHPIVINVPEDALSLVKKLPEKLKAFFETRKAPHPPPLIFKSKSEEFCKAIQKVLEDPVWQRKHNAGHGAWSFPSDVFAVGEEVEIGHSLPSSAYCWSALETGLERVDRHQNHPQALPVYRRGHPGFGHMIPSTRTSLGHDFTPTDSCSRS